MSTYGESILLKSGEGGYPVIMDQEGIHIDQQDLPFSDLLVLPTVLSALRPTGNPSHTLRVDNNIDIVDADTPYPAKNVNIGIGVFRMTDTQASTTITLDNGFEEGDSTIQVATGGVGVTTIKGNSQTIQATSAANVTYLADDAPDKSINMYVGLGQTTVTLNDGVTSYCQLWPNKLKISDGYTTDGLTEIGLKTISQNNITTNESITISTEGDATISLAKDGIGAAQLKGEGTCLRLDSCANVDLKLNSNTAKTFIGDTDAVGNNTVIMVDDVLRCTSFRSGMMNRTLEIFSAGLAIRPQYTFVTSNGYDCTLRSPTDYYNPFTTHGDGWYCYVFNNSGNDFTLSNMGDYKMFIHPTGPSTNILVKKYSTVRVTLVYAEDYQGDFVWSVSMF